MNITLPKEIYHARRKLYACTRYTTSLPVQTLINVILTRKSELYTHKKMSYATIIIWVIGTIFLVVAWATAESNSRRGLKTTKTANNRIRILNNEISMLNDKLEHAQRLITEVKNSNEDLIKFKEAYYTLKRENAQMLATNNTYAELVKKLQTRLLNTEYAGNSLAAVLIAEIEKNLPSDDPKLKDKHVQNTFQKIKKSMK